jgi:prepilin-type N-terminal cleavage/methylation domain-containing protein/prepilin-type processing-associated H-X9-DG protein
MFRGTQKRFRKSLANGFTLVEMLIVIAIIVVLAAISVIAMRALKEKAAATKCMSQLREWSTAIHGYAGDHNQMVLFERWSMVGGSDTKAYNSYLSTTDGKTVMPNGEEGIALAYYRRCPSQWNMSDVPDRGYFLSKPVARQPNGSYSKNGAWVDTDGQTSSSLAEDSYSLARISNPAQFLMMMDADERAISPYRASELTDLVKPICENHDDHMVRHNGKVHGLFADGHIEIFKWSEVDPTVDGNAAKTARWFQMD